MSIREITLEQVRQGLLVPILPRSPRAVIRRSLFMHIELFQELEGGGEDGYINSSRKGQIRADLDVFVTSETIDPKYCFWLTPRHDRVWEIRSVRDEPSVRILGLFAEQDVFIATNMERRDNLGGFESEQWKLAKRNALVKWRHVFANYEPIGEDGDGPNKFFTGALPGQYFKR